MATININGLQLCASELAGVKMYVSISRRKSYKNIKDFEIDRAKTIINFMRSIYISEHPFDELEALNNIYKESTDVATLLFPRTDELRKVVEVLINFTNMLALCPDNYKKYQTHTLALDDTQTKLIRSKAKALFNAFNDIQLTSAGSDRTLSLLAQIDKEKEACRRHRAQIDRRKDYVIESIKYAGKTRNVELYTIQIKCGRIISGSDGRVCVTNGTRKRGRQYDRHIENGDVVITAGSNWTRTYAVCDLIAMCFCPWYDNSVIITHINGDIHDNRPENLAPLTFPNTPPTPCPMPSAS